MHLLLAGERAALEDEEIVLRSGGFLAVDPEFFHWRLAPARLDLRGSSSNVKKGSRSVGNNKEEATPVSVSVKYRKVTTTQTEVFQVVWSRKYDNKQKCAGAITGLSTQLAKHTPPPYFASTAECFDTCAKIASDYPCLRSVDALCRATPRSMSGAHICVAWG